MSTFRGHLYNCWQFNDSLVGSNGQPFQMSSPVFEPGKFGNGLRLTVGGSSAAALGTGGFKSGGVDWTTMLWLKPVTLPASSCYVASNLNGRNGGWDLLLNSGGILTFGIREGTNSKKNIAFPVPLLIGVNHLIIFGYNLFTQKTFFRVNDTQVDYSVSFAANAGTPANLILGSNHGDPISGLDAVVDLLALWQSWVLEEDQMQALWNGGAGLDYPFA